MTDKNKEQFEKWYIESYIRQKENIGLHVFGTKIFERTPIGYKIGVYLAYYKEVHNKTIVVNIDNAQQQLNEFDELINQQLNNK